jgi:hypothetical protein
MVSIGQVSKPNVSNNSFNNSLVQGRKGYQMNCSKGKTFFERIEPYFSIPRSILGISLWTVYSIYEGVHIGDPNLPYSSPDSTIGKTATVVLGGLAFGLFCGAKFKKIFFGAEPSKIFKGLLQ